MNSIKYITRLKHIKHLNNVDFLQPWQLYYLSKYQRFLEKKNN